MHVRKFRAKPENFVSRKWNAKVTQNSNCIYIYRYDMERGGGAGPAPKMEMQILPPS